MNYSSTVFLTKNHEKMALDPLTIGMQAGAEVLGTGLGMLTANWNDRRQLEQQKKLNDLQVQSQARMGAINQGLALDLWEKTNYAAQVEQLQKAGLNVGLMYKSAGEGGRTNTPTGSITGATAPGGGGELGMGMQLGLQNLLMKAQIENINADTHKKNVEATKTGGPDTAAVLAGIENLKTVTDNNRIQGEIMKLDKTLKEIETNIAQETAETVIQRAILSTNSLVETVRQQRNANAITEGTMTSIITQSNNAVEEQLLRISAQKLGLIKIGAETKLIGAQIQKVFNDIIMDQENNNREWDRLSLEDRKTVVSEKLMENDTIKTNFETSTPEKIKQWTELIFPWWQQRKQNEMGLTNVVGIGGIMKGLGATKTIVKGFGR